MLRIMRNNTKSVIWLIIGVFIFCYVIGSALTAKTQRSYAAKIFNKKISNQEYKTFYDIVFYSEKFQNLMQGNLDIPESFLMNTALQYIALYYAAKKEGIKISDKKVQETIKQQFSINGVFNTRLYETHVSTVLHKSLRAYEESVRKGLIVNAYLDSMKQGVTVDDEEVVKAFELENNQYVVAYIPFPSQTYINKVPISEENLQMFYDTHKKSFEISEKYSCNFLKFSPEQYMADVQIDDYEIEEYYDTYSAQFIDPDTQQPSPLSSVSDTIKQELTMQKAKERAITKAQEVQKIIQDEKSFKKGIEAAGVAPQKTTFKTTSELMEVFGWAKDFYERLEEMPVNTIKTLDTSKGAFVVIITEKEYAYTPPLVDIIDSVKEKYVKAEAETLAQNDANKIYEKITNGTLSFDAASQQLGATAQKIGPFSARTQINSPIGHSSRLGNLLAGKKPGDVLPPLKMTDGYAIATLLDLTSANQETFNAESENYRKRLQSVKVNEVLNNKISAVLQKADIKNYLVKSEDPFADIQ